VKKILFTLALLISTCAFSAGRLTKNGSLTELSAEDVVVTVRYTANDILDPMSCGNNGVAILDGDDKNTDRQFSILLAAKMSGKSIKMYTHEECFIGWGQKWSKIWMVSVE